MYKNQGSLYCCFPPFIQYLMKFMCEIALTESSQLFLPICPFPFPFGEIWLSALEPFGCLCPVLSLTINTLMG